MTFDNTDDNNISSLNIYPNPSRGKLYIEFDIFEDDDFKISIIDAVGNAILIEEKQNYIKKFGKNAEDTGSSEAQIAILTHRIRELTDHVKTHKKDHHTRRGLVQLVSKRKRLLKYLMRSNAESYVNLIKELSIRG